MKQRKRCFLKMLLENQKNNHMKEIAVLNRKVEHSIFDLWERV
jgi:hypothetical protein